ncbi:PPOX class probable F420-dependent enzyme, Rv0121 family [Amycolatopsis lurida]|uniref:F420-dependent protein n=1 Tax=Amycolatopsis lurida NRRL 2430 TaxID=1460371 RepID=A0A2P2G0K2_AMYLU|nr:TIGR03668 family PPOX class F420-dependent oxidoreductase [Amycolatopsis lurida]KFU82508.1 F420-dependent protein [Amycolatopsis lurida NRRL 2430]SEB40652.1 PPOX class probable F420-dependent enzyme, Rv0121 family [Amycolatopsis lurida]
MRMTPAEARSRFEGERVARLATTGSDGVPHVVPVTFVLEGDSVAFAIDHKPKSTTALRRLKNIAENPLVSFLTDHYAEDWAELWWARADGVARVLTDPDEQALPVRLLREKYPQYEAQPPPHAVVTTLVHAWSGWRAS